MTYGIEIVDDGDLPNGRDWLLVKMTTGRDLLCVARSLKHHGDVWLEVYAAYQAPRQSERVLMAS